MNLIWATRGRTWGFRFLRDGGFEDPLPEYEEAFSGLESGSEVWHRVRENVVALRIPDPLGREDFARRSISHDFVIFGALGAGIGSAEDGRRNVWPLVADEYSQVWELPSPPARTESSGG